MTQLVVLSLLLLVLLLGLISQETVCGARDGAR